MAQDKQLRPEAAEQRERNKQSGYPAATPEPQRLAAGRITSGNFGAGYTVDVLGEDGQTVTTYTKVRKQAGDVVLVFTPGESQPSLVFTPLDLADAGEGCLTVFSS